jgi:4-oxalocrotonate tautomerase family enzyme
MPYVLVQTGGPLTIEQKRTIAEDIYSSLERVAGKPRANTNIVFQEISRESWSSGGEILADRDARNTKK